MNPNSTQTQSTSARSPFDLVIVGGWFGLLTGLAEVLYLAAAKFILHRYIHQGPDIAWMVPLADLVLFLLVGLVLYGLARLFPRLVTMAVAVGVYTFLACISILFMITSLDKLAALVLAAGIAVQSARFVARRPAFVDGLLERLKSRVQGRQVALPSAIVEKSDFSLLNRRQFLLASGATVAALAVGVQSWRVYTERTASSNRGVDASASPNILLIVLDTVRAQSMSVNGYPRLTTPNLNRLGQRGVTFQRAISTCSWSLPAHASLFTGYYPHQLNTNWEAPLNSEYPTLAEILGGLGYATAGFVANTYYCSTESGLARGFQHYADYKIAPDQVAATSSLIRTIAEKDQMRDLIGWYQLLGRKSAEEVNQEFLAWLSRQNPELPFFAFLNYFDAHMPFVPPSPFAERFNVKARRFNPMLVPGKQWAPSDISEERDAYEGSIAYLDYQLGALFDTLERQGIADNTYIVVTSDHGEEFSEHRVFGHGHSLYLPSLLVPLIIAHPSLPVGKQVMSPVSLRDVPSTVLDLVGLKERVKVPGTSLRSYWDSRVPSNAAGTLVLSEVDFAPNGLPKWYPINLGDLKSMVQERYHYIRSGEDKQELYDVENDPWEQEELSGTPQGQVLIRDLSRSLEQFIARPRETP